MAQHYRTPKRLILRFVRGRPHIVGYVRDEQHPRLLPLASPEEIEQWQIRVELARLEASAGGRATLRLG